MTATAQPKMAPSAAWYVMGAAVLAMALVGGAVWSGVVIGTTIAELSSEELGPASAGLIAAEEQLDPGTYAVAFRATGLERQSGVPEVSLTVDGPADVEVRENPSDAYFEGAFRTSDEFDSTGRGEVAVFRITEAGEYQLDGEVVGTPPSDGEWVLYPFRLRDESDEQGEGAIDALQRVAFGVGITGAIAIVAVVAMVVVAVQRHRARRPASAPSWPR